MVVNREGGHFAAEVVQALHFLQLSVSLLAYHSFAETTLKLHSQFSNSLLPERQPSILCIFDVLLLLFNRIAVGLDLCGKEFDLLENAAVELMQ